jgi:hypothetical protein
LLFVACRQRNVNAIKRTEFAGGANDAAQRQLDGFFEANLGIAADS